jgi:phosphatidylserine/phosphatidylglycerophosphate/cardiolipin synthase-like enzyme
MQHLIPEHEGIPDSQLRLCVLWPFSLPMLSRTSFVLLLFFFSVQRLAGDSSAISVDSGRQSSGLLHALSLEANFSRSLLEDPAAIAPGVWGEMALNTCSLQEKEWEANLKTLEDKVRARSESLEQLAFPRKELRARAKQIAWQQRAQLARLDYLLLGDKAETLGTSAQQYRGSAGLPRVHGSTPLTKAAKLLFGQASPCNLATLESTFFFSVLGVPFTGERLEEGLDIHRLQADLDSAYRARLKDAGSLENLYLLLRPQDPENAFSYVDEITARLAQLEELNGPGPAGHPLANSPHTSRFERGPEFRALLEQFQLHIRMAAEPLRIQFYLRAKVGEIQGALRSSIPEAATEKLLLSAERTLYRDEPALAQLAKAPAREVLAKLEPILDKWFRKEALPTLQESLYNDPFSAYWFFVQTGAVSRTPLPYKDSHIGLRPGSLDLESLKGLRLVEALAQFRRQSVPSHFVVAHAALERAFTDVVINPEDVLKQIDAVMLEPKYRDKLRQHFTASRNREALSTADVYGWVIRDANKIGGSLDRDLVRASLLLLDHAKRERLRQTIPELLLSNPEETRARLKDYLGTLSEIMLELELRQATDKHFQDSTTGGFTGWMLSHLLMSTGVPVELWAPGGVTSDEFADLLDNVAPKNKKSGDEYHGKPTEQVRLLHDGQEFHEGLVEAIASSKSFLNLTSLDWKLDQGGKEIGYRLMAKKLGVEGEQLESFLGMFRRGLPLQPGAGEPTLFYDIPPGLMKNLLVFFFFQTSELPAIAETRRELESALSGELTCPSVATCGDLSHLEPRTGDRYNPARASESDYQQVWLAYQKLQNLFENEDLDLRATQPRASLAEYIANYDRMQTFVRRHGRKREDDPAQPFPINIIVDGKQDLMNLHFIRPNARFPFVYSDPYWGLYTSLYEFDIRLLLWKGALEFPWHFMNVPLPGRKVFHYIPFPFVPYPWLRFVPGFAPAGIVGSLFVQQMMATDPRTWWAMVAHAKSVSSDSTAIQSGMGFATKYFDGYDGFLTWHDMGIEVKGPIVGDVNDQFVLLFNEARVNNGGLPGSRKVKIPPLRYEDYRYSGAESSGSRSWVFVTHPERGDASYRGAYMAALASARKNIFIETPWLTDPLVTRMLLHKAREFRGRVDCTGLDDFACSVKMREAVKIYLVLPDQTDQRALDVVGRAELREMLHLGVKIFWWSPKTGWSATKMLHTKSWLIDYEEGEPGLAYLGSANATQRSHLADNEVGIITTSPEFAGESYDRLFGNDFMKDTRAESPESFHFPWASRRLARSAHRLQRVLVDLFWFF